MLSAVVPNVKTTVFIVNIWVVTFVFFLCGFRIFLLVVCFRYWSFYNWSRGWRIRRLTTTIRIYSDLLLLPTCVFIYKVWSSGVLKVIIIEYYAFGLRQSNFLA